MKKRGGKIDREKDAKRQRVTKRINQDIESKVEKAFRENTSSLPVLGAPDLFGDRPAYDKTGKQTGVHVASGNMKRPHKHPYIA